MCSNDPYLDVDVLYLEYLHICMVEVDSVAINTKLIATLLDDGCLVMALGLL